VSRARAVARGVHAGLRWLVGVVDFRAKRRFCPFGVFGELWLAPADVFEEVVAGPGGPGTARGDLRAPVC
jgi:hypothetical protein